MVGEVVVGQQKSGATKPQNKPFTEKLIDYVRAFRNGQMGSHPLDGVDLEHHADWLDEVDMVDPLICSYEALDELVKRAPTSETRGWLIGVMEVRMRIKFITGGKF